MTVSSNARKAGPLSCNGSVVDFDFDFTVTDEDDIQVILATSAGVETVLTNPSDYSVALNADQDSDPGGTVTTVTTYAAGYTVTILGALAYAQTTEITNLGGFFPKVIERALDRIVIYAQQLREVLDRTITLRKSVTGVTLEIPEPVANAALGWNADATALANITNPGNVVTTAFGETLIGSANAATARTALGISFDAAASWLATTPQPNLAWIATGAAASFKSTDGGLGASGVARTSDSADSGSPAAIGLTGFGYNDDTYAKPAWGAYVEGKSSSTATGFTAGIELDSANNRSFLDITSYTAIASTTAVDIGAWVAAGGDAVVNPSANDSSAGVVFVHNGAKWGKGIVFLDDSLRVRSLGAYSTMVAMEMAEDQSVQWVNPDGNRAAWIASTCATAQKSLGLAFITGAARLVDDEDGVQLQVSKTGSATSFVSITGSSTGLPVISAGNDAGGNASLVFKGLGTGGHYFQNAAGATQFEVSSTASATSFIQITGSVAGTPTITASSGSVRVGTPLILAKGTLNPVPRTITAATGTVTTDDNFVICDRAAGTVTLTLPTASGVPGFTFTVKTIQAQTVVSAGSDVVPLAGGAAGTAILAGTAGKWATLASNGTNYDIMAAG